MKARRLRFTINMILGLCCLVLLTYIFSVQVFNGQQDTQQGIQLIQANRPITNEPGWRWFDSSNSEQMQESAARNAEQEQLAEASINAELLGVMRTPTFATATISIDGRPEKVFSIGDELQSGVELVSVSTSRVVLDERGRRVQITMRRPQELPAQSVNSGAAAKNDAVRLQGGFSLANMFEAVPVQVGTGSTGFKLDGISEEMLSLSEIEEGDVVIQVGSSTIDELMANPGQWMNYSTETTLPVTVMRNGQETTLFVNAASLSARILPNLTNELMR